MLGLDPLTAGALLTLAASSSDFCRMPKPTKIDVTPRSQKIEYDYSQTLAQIQSQQTDTINPYDFGGVSHTQGFMKGSIQMVPSVKLASQHHPQQGVTCLWYDSVEIKFDIEPTIVIAKEVAQDRCMRAAVLQHEKKHVLADRRVVNKYAKEMGRKVYKALKQRGFIVGPIPASNAKAVAERMQQTVFQIVEHEYKKLEIDRAEAQQAIDSLGEYNRVNARCPNFNARPGDAEAAARAGRKQKTTSRNANRSRRVYNRGGARN